MPNSSTCYMLFKFTDDKADPFKYLNEDLRELLNGDVYDTEEAAATALMSSKVKAPILIQLDVSASKASLWKESGSAQELAKHVIDVNRKEAKFDGEKIQRCNLKY